MKGYNHVAFSTLLGFGVQAITGFPTGLPSLLAYPSYYGGTVLGSLFPDIDHPQSYLGRRFKVLSVPIFKMFGHRGFTHSLLFIGLLGIATAFIWAYNPYFFGGFLLGNFSHLLADMTTPSGIPLFYPSKRRYKFFKKAGNKR